MKAVMMRLLHTGTSDFQQHPEIAIRLVLTNSIAMFAASMSIAITALQFVTGQWILMLFNTIVTATFLTVITANKLGFIYASRSVMIIFSLFLIVFNSWLYGVGIGLYQFTFAIAGVCFLLFRQCEYRWIAATLLCSFTTHLFLYSVRNEWQSGILELPPETLSAMRWAYWAFSFLAATFPLAVFLYLTKRYEGSLESSREKLVQVSRLHVLGEMAGGIVHEISNPLTIIIGRARYLSVKIDEETATAEILKQGLRNISDTAMRIANISQTLSRISHSSTEDVSNRHHLVSIKGIVDDLLLNYESKIKHAGARVTNNLVDETVCCAPLEITHVLLNILNNALDALSEVEDRNVEILGCRNGDTYELRISNSGPVMEAEVADRIFDPYFTTKDIGKGTGLGLSLCRKIMKLNNGEINLDRQATRTSFVLSIAISPKIQAAA